MQTSAKLNEEKAPGCADGCKRAISCWKPCLYSQPQIALAPLVKTQAACVTGVKEPQPLAYAPGTGRFVIGFCGSGTGHLTQSLAVLRMLQARGMTLAGIVFDTDATQKMVQETLEPLGVSLLQLPAIKLVDPKKGMVPTVVTLHSVITGVGKLRGMYPQLVSFFVDAKAEYIFNFWHTTLAFFLRSHPPPPGVRISNVAPQFALSSLDVRDLGFWEIVGKSTIDAMAALIAQTGPCLSLSARPQPNSLPPILEVPAAVSSFSSRLILCYFLAQPDAVRLERLLAQFSISGVEIHCFTTAPLTPPAGRPLALESHAKQRALFKHYFDRCTGIICSTGNETIWEAVCRGVPVLTVPTSGHPEQMMNARIHGRAFPASVRAVSRVRIEDVRWLVDFKPSEESIAESSALRERATTFDAEGARLLCGA